MDTLEGYLLFMTVMTLTKPLHSLCGVDDYFVSPENDQMAYQIFHPLVSKNTHASVCESFGPGKVIIKYSYFKPICMS